MPMFLNSFPPRPTIDGTYAMVLTLLMLVGFWNSHACAGKGGL